MKYTRGTMHVFHNGDMPSVCIVHTQTSTQQEQQLLVLWVQAELTRAVTDSTVCCVCINWYVLLTIEYFSPSSWVSESSGYQNTCNLDSMHTHTHWQYMPLTTITHCTQQHIYYMQCRGQLTENQSNYSGTHTSAISFTRPNIVPFNNLSAYSLVYLPCIHMSILHVTPAVHAHCTSSMCSLTPYTDLLIYLLYHLSCQCYSPH